MFGWRLSSTCHRVVQAAAAACLASACCAATAAGEGSMQLSSSAIAGDRIATVHACRAKGGQDQPPPLDIRGIPAEARFLAIVADDPDAMKPAGKVWVHWNRFDVPVAGAHMEIAAGQALGGEAGRTSGHARGGYEGPCPPDGVHAYRFAVFASREPLRVDTHREWTLDAFEAKYGSQVLAKAVITGRFGP
jgi:Raf kinase inhibitor-like YbhB/YbcL family protein